VFRYFLTYQSNLPEGIGFGLFSATHLFVLCLLGVIIALLCVQYKKLSQDKRLLMRSVMVVIMFAMEWGRHAFLFFSGQYEPALLPLHLCALSIWVEIFDAFKSNKTTRETLYALSLPGALAALLTPDWVNYPIMNIFAWHSFLIHMLLSGYIIMRLVAGEIVPDAKQLWRPSLLLAITVPIILVINAHLGTNFFFLNAAVAGSPLEFLQTTFHSFYIVSMIGLLVVVWFFMYMPWELVRLKKARELRNI
jgi:hypothetical integral membrane protein (TIGR02206 family)